MGRNLSDEISAKKAVISMDVWMLALARRGVRGVRPNRGQFHHDRSTDVYAVGRLFGDQGFHFVRPSA
jgi:hypothetical protein